MAESKGKVVSLHGGAGRWRWASRRPGTRMRWLIDDTHDGAPVYALRMVEIEPGGHSPHHQHRTSTRTSSSRGGAACS